MVISRRALATLAAVTLLLSIAGLAQAGVNADWRELGGSASTTGVSKTPTGNFSVSSSVAPGLDGRPVVAYSEESLSGNEDDGAIIVKRWTGAAWQTLSPVGGVGSRGFGTQIKVARNGTIYVAWLGATDGNVHLRRRTATGTVWEQLSGSDGPFGLTGFNTSLVRSFSLAVASDNSPLVAFTAPAQAGVSAGTDGILQGSYQAYVVQHTGTSWQYLGSTPFTPDGGGASNARSFSVDGGNFYAMHGVGFLGDAIRLAVDSANRPVVAFAYSTEYAAGAPVEFLPSGPNNTHRDLFATRWEANTSTWTSLGPEVPQVDFNAGRGAPGGISVTSRDVSHFDLAAAPTGDRLYITWSDDDFVLESAIYVRRFDGTDWEEVGTNSASGDGISGGGYHSSPTVAVDANSNGIVAWTRSGVPAQQIFVLRSNGFNEWEEMGPDSASGDGISGNGPGAGGIRPWVAYFDGPSAALPDNTVVTWINFQSGQPSQVYLRQFTQGARFPLNVNVTSGGRVVSSPIGIDCPDDTCSALFPTGQVVSLTPIAGPDHLFDRFLGACTGAICNVLMTANRSVNASFVGAATLTVVKDGLGTVTGTGISCGTDCSEKYRLGTVVNLVVSMPTGTLFGGWGGACLFRGTNASCPLTIGSNQTVTADFYQRLYRLSVTVDNPATTVVNGVGGFLNASADGAALFTCDYDEGACTADVEHGQDVLLRTFEVGANRFVNYLGAPCAGRTNATCPFEMLANYSITALLRGVTAIQVNKVGNGASKGTVTGPGISCGNDCLGEAFTGTQVVITQTPGIGNRLVGFTGPCSGQTCSFLASGSNQTINASYQLNRHALFVTGAPGTTQGYSLSTPSGIDCGNFGGHFDCTEIFDYGTTVTVTAIPDTNSRFLSWAGCSRVNGPVCEVDMTSNRTTTKAFGAARTLFVSGSGNGGGVYSIPGQPNLVCQGNCSTSYLLPFNQPVVITPKADTGSNFRWLSGCPGNGACTQLMSSNRTTVGEFRLNRHSILVTNRLNGSVTSNIFPDSSLIDCGSGNNICTNEQDYNTLVNLQAVPDEGNIFVNWTGTSPCSAPGRATNSSCSLQLQGNYTFIPNFRAATVVDLFKDGNGQGSIGVTGTLSPAAPVCGPTCTTTRFTAFDSRPVILKATPSLGSRFVSYGGDCVSNTSTCTHIPSGANDSITATFVFQQFALNVTDRLNGTVTGTIPPSTQVIGCGSVGDDCTETLDFNTEVTLTALANPDFLFVSWAGDAVCAGKTTTFCSFRMPNRIVNVTPVYRARTFVALLKDGNGQGTLTATGTLSPVAPVCGPTCSSTSFLAFDSKPVILRATPSLGSNFVTFQGDCTSNTSTCTYIPSGSNDTVTGTFVLQQFALNVTDRLNGTVTGTIPPTTQVIGCGSVGDDCTETLDFNTEVTLTALANPDFLFVSWAGDAVCAGKTTTFCSFRMPNRVVNVTPVYRARTFVTLLKDGNGQGSVAATGTLSPVAPVCGPTCSSTTFAALDGKPVTLRATPSVGSNFVTFQGDCTSNTSTCTYIPSGSNDTVTGTFVLQQFALNVTDRPNGTVTGTTTVGTVIECGLGGDDCSETIDFSTAVTLVAAQNADAIFLNWTGDAVCAGKTNNTCFFTMPNRVVNVTPVYRTRTVVTLLKDGNGQGTLTATGTLSPVAPTCGPTCPSTSFLAFDSKLVTLRATPSVGSVFTSFTGDCVSNSSTCTYFPSGGNDTITGTFTLQQFQLNVSNQTNGNVDGPIGLDCGAGAIVCSVVQTFGDPVSLVADPADGFVFVNWTGDAACSGKTNSTCAFSMPNRNVTVTPNYRRESTVTVFPDGQGTVTGTGISCVSGLSGVTGDCSQTLTNGVSLTLTATPATGWDFSFWDDPSCGSFNGSVCTITPAVDSVQVFPVFSREPRIATVLVSGNGSVVSGFDQCDHTSTPCQFSRQFGDTVILTATPAVGFDFFSWTGCQSTNGSACTLQMTANRTATVTFLPTPAASITVGQGGGLVFSAANVTIAVGDTVRWTWAASNHNVVSGNTASGQPDNVFCNPSDVNCTTAPLVGPPTVYSHTFNSAGTFTYFCRQHRLSGMTGTITVE